MKPDDSTSRPMGEALGSDRVPPADGAASDERGRLALNVFRDAAELRVVVVADDRDPHVGDDRIAVM